MKKLYTVAFNIIFLFSFYTAFSQAPVISYTSPQTISTGLPNSISPVSTGGAVPNEVYSLAGAYAGSGAYGNQNGSAATATFENPVGLVVDVPGNVYVADANANCIRKISLSGVVTTFAGSTSGVSGNVNGNDTAARFNYPTGMAIDAYGNIYVADFGNSLIRKITPAGVVSTFAGSVMGYKDAVGTAAQFNFPYGIAFDKNGNLLVADTYNYRIRKVAADGTVTTYAGSGTPGFQNGAALAANFNVPKGIATDTLGNTYIAEEGNNVVRKIDNNGNVTTFASGVFALPIGLTVDKLGHVYVSSENKYNIYEFNSNGTQVGTQAFSGGSTKGSTNDVDTSAMYGGNMGLYFDGRNNIFLTDPTNYLVRKVAVNGYHISPKLPYGLNINGTGTIFGTPTTIAPATTYTISAYNNSGAYTTTLSLIIGLGTQTITFSPIAATTYGSADFSPGATSNDTINPITYSSSNLAVATIVNNKIHIIAAGATNITANQAGNTSVNAAAPVTQPLVVNPATLTVTANNQVKTVGNANPTLTFTYSGFVNGDSASALTTAPVAQTTATTGSPAGTYPITVSGAVAANYTFTYVPGNLVVFPVPVVNATGSTTTLQGDSVLLTASPATGYTYQWAFNGVIISGATNATYEAKQTGSYSVSISSNGYSVSSAAINIIAQLVLPLNNFTLKINSTSCDGTNNGSVFIAAAKNLNYTATITGNGLNTPYTFTDTVTIANLAPGIYSICITVAGQVYSQCFQVTITQPQALSVYAALNPALKVLDLQLGGGNTYNIVVNGTTTYTTTANQITVPLSAGLNKVLVTTDRLCQGSVEKDIDLSGAITPYPNPFSGILNLNIGNGNVSNVQVNIVNLFNGSSVYKSQYYNQSGVMQFDLSALTEGIYYLYLSLDNQQSGYKIIKK